MSLAKHCSEVGSDRRLRRCGQRASPRTQCTGTA
jgi:hypothetical protein